MLNREPSAKGFPMPSPKGTNKAQLFLKTNPRAAYDAANGLGESDKYDPPRASRPKGEDADGITAEVIADTLKFLADKISTEDLGEVERMLKNALSPEELSMQTPAMDSIHRAIYPRSAAQAKSFDERYPHARKVRNLG